MPTPKSNPKSNIRNQKEIFLALLCGYKLEHKHSLEETKCAIKQSYRNKILLGFTNQNELKCTHTSLNILDIIINAAHCCHACY